MRRPSTPKKRSTVSRRVKPRTTVDPTRLALAALERIRTVVSKSGQGSRLGEPLSMKELAAQTTLLAGNELPPSYFAAMRVASQIGAPVEFLDAAAMGEASHKMALDLGKEAARFLPFATQGELVFCFDKLYSRKRKTSEGVVADEELPVYALEDRAVRLFAHNFAEWLDGVADEREEAVEKAAKLPRSLKRLLYELGFRFEFPLVGRVQTGDVEAIEWLIGEPLARRVREDTDRLFDATGRASLSLNVDEFSLTCALRTGTFVFDAEQVFRWLRKFRDENFFGDTTTPPSHADRTRDLRRAPREAPLVQRGAMQVPSLGATRYAFVAASGSSPSDFYLLGRGAGAKGDRATVILHVVDGQVATARTLDERLDTFHVTPEGTIWGLSGSSAVRVTGGASRVFRLTRPTLGKAAWSGIGGGGDRVLVWGAGALLVLDGEEFVPFAPDAQLDSGELVVQVVAHRHRIAMLVCGSEMGAIARFDSVGWEPIGEDEVVEGELADFDVSHGSPGAAFVLDRAGNVWRVSNGRPHEIPIDWSAAAFTTDGGARRRLHGIRSQDSALFLASDGGVVVMPAEGTSVFYRSPNARAPMRIVRVGPSPSLDALSTTSGASGVVALGGGHAWVWGDGDFHVLDLREW